jgi:hypothetical protein
MTPLYRPLVLVFTISVAALFAACGGGGDDGSSSRSGNLTDPRDVPTATPWAQAPDVVLLDPNNIQPLPPLGTPEPGASDGGEATPVAGECGATYTVVSGDTPSGIAEKCGVTTDELLNANPGLDPAAMHVGDVVNIPGGGE